MADQIWYAWSRNGLRGRDGWQPRAVSAGIRSVEDPRFKTIAPYLVFHLPDDVDPVRMDTAEAPLCLTLAVAGDERVLVHRTIVGARDTSGRPTVYFTHALAGLPPEITAREAIRLWRAPFWQSSDERLPGDQIALESVVPERLAAGPLEPGAFSRPGVVALLEPAIAAYCSLRPDQRLYIAAVPDDVATVIYGLTRALPRGLLSGLTFTTYQPGQAVLRAETRLVGTSWWRGQRGVFATPQDDLPARCYQSGLVVNGFDRERSSVPDSDPVVARFARFAAERLTSGQLQRLDALVASAEESGVVELGSYLTLFRLLEADALRRDDLPILLDYPAVAARQLGLAPVRQFFLDHAVTEPDWWRRAVGPRLSGPRRARQPELDAALRALAMEAVERAGRLLVETRDLGTAGFLLDDVAAVVIPGERRRQTVAFFRFVTKLTDGPPDERFPWEVRAWLLERWAGAAGDVRGPRFLRWLQVSWSEIEDFLSLALPREWHLAGIEALVQDTGRTGQLPATAAAILARRRPEFQAALADLLRGREESEGVTGFYGALRAGATPDLKQWLTFLLECPAADPSFNARLLEVAGLADDEIMALVEGELQRLSGEQPLADGWVVLFAAYANALSVADRRRQPARRVLDTLTALGSRMPEEVRAPLEGWRALFAFLESPELDPVALGRFAGAARRVPVPERELQQLLQEVVGALGPRVRSRRELRDLVDGLAPAAQADRWRVFVDVAHAYVAAAGARPSADTFQLFWLQAREQRAPGWVTSELRALSGHPNLQGPGPASPRRPARAGPTAPVDDLDGRRRGSHSSQKSPMPATSAPPRDAPSDDTGGSGAFTGSECSAASILEATSNPVAANLGARARAQPAEVWTVLLAPALRSAEQLDGTGVWNLPQLEELIGHYLDALPLPAIRQAAAFGVMRRILASSLSFSPALRNRATSATVVAAFLGAPSFDRRDLQTVGRALTSPAVAGLERRQSATWLAQRLAPAIRTSTDVGNLVETLGAALLGNGWDFYQVLLEAHLGDPALRRDVARGAVYLDYALSRRAYRAAGSEARGVTSHDPVPSEVLSALHHFVERSGRRLARHVDHLAGDWPVEGRQAWRELKGGMRHGPLRLPWRRRLRPLQLP